MGDKLEFYIEKSVFMILVVIFLSVLLITIIGMLLMWAEN